MSTPTTQNILATQAELQKASSALVAVSAAVHDAFALIPSSPGTTPITDELNKAKALITTSASAVITATALLSPPASQLQIVLVHLWGKITEGALLGVALLFIAIVDRSGVFFNYMHGNLSTLPWQVVLAGLVSGYLYFLATKGTIYARAASAWLDLVQQFFCLSVGAFWVLQLGHVFRSIVTHQPYAPNVASLWTTFGGLVVGAFFSGAMWSLRDTPMSKLMNCVSNVGFVAGALLLLLLLAI
jgi:hypothetical protein